MPSVDRKEEKQESLVLVEVKNGKNTLKIVSSKVRHRGEEVATVMCGAQMVCA